MPTPPAADCHAHAFDPKYPFATGTHYMPDPSQQGTAEQFMAVLEAHGFSHGLLVGAVPYAGDSRPILDAISAAKDRFKGIVLIRDPEINERKLQALADAGVVGIRFNLMSFGLAELTAPEAKRLLGWVKDAGWFVQLHLHEDDLLPAVPLLEEAGVRLMFDHFGRPNLDRGLDQPGFQRMLEFGRTGNAVCKLSGPFRCSRTGYPFADVDPYIEAVIDAFTLDNCVWGSDWPFVRMDERVDYGPPLTCLPRWLPDESDQRKVLWETPQRLFGFAPI